MTARDHYVAGERPDWRGARPADTRATKRRNRRRGFVEDPLDSLAIFGALVLLTAVVVILAIWGALP